jgi:DNA polymerase III subunit gamma/tau
METDQYEALYRRFRPQKFSELRGQDHVGQALKNAILNNRIGHAYLFSGPRGTGKTTTARILAKALNCTDLNQAEPCGKCDSCVAISKGISLDVHELDAASNNGVDAMRDLVARAALGTPGRWKVYIIDEVHMLSSAASNALLKTLEEPPTFVVFVLATTDPQKVLPTIRSRTQHFEFHLLQNTTLSDLLSQVASKAELGLDNQAIEIAVKRAKGSARDALSYLDLLSASGSIVDDSIDIAELVDAISEASVTRVFETVNRLISSGIEPNQIVGDLIDYLRIGFLAQQAPDLEELRDYDTTKQKETAFNLGLAKLVRAMEILGNLQIQLRESIDPRTSLEVALIRIIHPEADDSLSSILERLQRLERKVAEVSKLRTTDDNGPEHWPGSVSPKGSSRMSKPPLTLPGEKYKGVEKRQIEFNRDELVQAWGNELLTKLNAKERAVFGAGRFISAESNGTIVLGVESEASKKMCQSIVPKVETLISNYFGVDAKITVKVEAQNIDEPNETQTPLSSKELESEIKRIFPGATETSK